MKVNIDRYRILHLILLIAISSVVAETLVTKLDWTRMSAYGFACSVTSQVSQRVYSILNPSEEEQAADAAEKKRLDKRERVLEKRRGRKIDAEFGSTVKGKKKK